MPSLNLNPEVHFRVYAAILKNRYDVITPPPIFWSLRNLEDRCKMTRRWLHIRQNRNQMGFLGRGQPAAKRFYYILSTQDGQKPEVVHLGRGWRYFIEIWFGNRFPTP